jgi:hypothetical protein
VLLQVLPASQLLIALPIYRGDLPTFVKAGPLPDHRARSNHATDLPKIGANSFWS